MPDMSAFVVGLAHKIRPSSRGPIGDVAWAARAALTAVLLSAFRALFRILRRQISAADFVFRTVVVGPILATVPAYATLVALMIVRWVQARRGRTFTDWLQRSVLRAFQLWAVLEVMHYLQYRIQIRILNRRRHLPPKTRKVVGRRTALLQHCFDSLDVVFREWPNPYLENPDNKSALRRTDAKRKGTGMAVYRSCCNLSTNPQLPSAENLLRMWSNEDHLDVSLDSDETERVMKLKRVEISGWFSGANMDEIGRGNIREFICEYLFNRSTEGEVAEEDRGEMEKMVEIMVQWLGLPAMPDIRNPNVRCKRLSRDSISSIHRPLWMYVLTGWTVPALTAIVCNRLGFTKFTSGVIQYWHRPSQRRNTGCGSGGSIPAVFCHGLGIGVLPYIEFLAELGLSGTELFLLDMPFISLQQRSEVPSCRETVACIVDMLTAWDHSEAHFIGHSFGTVIVSWMLKNSQAVSSASLLDPVCFLLFKHDIMTNAIYKDHDDILQIVLTYFVFRDLHVAHLLFRNFFWEQCELWPETVRRPMFVMLSGRDAIVPAHSVRRLLHAEQWRRRDTLAARGLGSRHASTLVRQLGGERMGVGIWHGEADKCGGATSTTTAPIPGVRKVASSGGIELSGVSSKVESEMQVASAKLTELWYPDLAHCEFVTVPKIRAEVVGAIHGMFKEAAGSQ
eukprot:TRINITY_DN55560_c0_g1_i1.p1 TRINITY_DN55560_c0_g1~~TRINITY_DN55560_c0_g1_i1.p1  ORF type:complete len:679 (-),score=72.11 TRINITY_DN55560_c0_g1_i1:329-2365(-)